MSLDLIGQARMLYTHAAELERQLTGATKTRTTTRTSAQSEFANFTLAELPHYGRSPAPRTPTRTTR
ncbi:phenylacetate-CoA oxygenase subunit PaaI [Burkholderia cenocepacia]|uniref:phenylacetate-CoA oxygenase subunit PaaI n=1 Tax=Burkholderia cenocepacia TaxID=95486 RepID=UPI00207C5E6A|nr:phenylacetate-CoA oxygenase subunit PaaI [Burkholderia cenocepacia]